MTTVKEFKDLGVEFIVDDKGLTFTVTNANAFNEQRISDLREVAHFTWRPLRTLPDNPKFKYELDTQLRFWRPLLDQSDSKVGEPTKPVFTQAVADVAVGFKLMFTHDIDGKFGHLHRERYGWEYGDNLEVIHKTINHNEDLCYIVLNCQSDVLTTAAITDLSFFDTRTPKQKAVDEMYKLWYECDTNSKNSFEAIYDAGYRKTNKDNI